VRLNEAVTQNRKGSPITALGATEDL